MLPLGFASGVPVISVAARVHLEATIALGSVSLGEGILEKIKTEFAFAVHILLTHVRVVSSVLPGG